jgi:hypothetical protein
MFQVRRLQLPRIANCTAGLVVQGGMIMSFKNTD